VTVVVAYVEGDAAVMASDSEATESGHTRYDVEKIWSVGGLLLGYTGTNSVRQPLKVSIEREVKNAFGDASDIPRWEGRSVLENATGPVLRHCYSTYVGTQPVENVLGGAILAIGHDTEGFWLLEIDHNVQTTFYDRFHTVGSGSPAAYIAKTLMAEYHVPGTAVDRLALMAHRTVQTCIDCIGGGLGVGGNVQLWSSVDGKMVEADTKELESLESGVESWRLIERESLDQFFAAKAGDEPEGEAMPEDFSEEAVDEPLAEEDDVAEAKAS